MVVGVASPSTDLPGRVLIGWLSSVIAEHYAGDDRNVGTLGAGVLAAFEGSSVEDFETQSEAFLRGSVTPPWAADTWTVSTHP